MIKAEAYRLGFLTSSKVDFPHVLPHLQGCNWTNYILSDIIGEILVRLEGFELSTPGSGDQCSIH